MVSYAVGFIGVFLHAMASLREAQPIRVTLRTLEPM